MKTNLIVDLSNIVYATHYTVLKKNSDFSQDFLLFKVIQNIKYYINEFKVDGVLIACDSPRVWRKEIYSNYKGDRNHEKDPYYPEVKQVMIDIKNFYNNYTSIPAISVERCEADDIIAEIVRANENKSIILSSDRDFIQLINDRVRLFSPSQDVERTCEDTDYELFEKCIRGDKGDNIFSAYPQVRKTVLEKAWENKKEGNDYDYINIMETVNKRGERVGDVFDFNKKLIDLNKQPPYIKDAITERINNIHENDYDSMKMLKFIGKRDLMGVKREFLRHSSVFKKHYINNKGE